MSANAASTSPVLAVRFPPALRALLEEHARKNGQTPSEVIRLAVRHWVEDEG